MHRDSTGLDYCGRPFSFGMTLMSKGPTKPPSRLRVTLIALLLAWCSPPAQAAGPRETSRPGDPAEHGWRLSQTTNEGRFAVTALRTADPAQSDTEIAGLMLRCADGNTDAILIMLSPLPPDAKPMVSLDLGGLQWQTQASVLPSGAGLLLSRDTIAFLGTKTKAGADLAFTVLEGGRQINARIAKLHAPPALDRIDAECRR